MSEVNVQSRPAKNVLDNNIWLNHTDDLAVAAGMPKGSVRISLVHNAGKTEAALCVNGRDQVQERMFKRAVEQAVQQEQFADLPALTVKGHYNCHAHLCR